jgi:hypothetical protein
MTAEKAERFDLWDLRPRFSGSYATGAFRGCVANFAQEMLKEQLPLSVE